MERKLLSNLQNYEPPSTPTSGKQLSVDLGNLYARSVQREPTAHTEMRVKHRRCVLYTFIVACYGFLSIIFLQSQARNQVIRVNLSKLSGFIVKVQFLRPCSISPSLLKFSVLVPVIVLSADIVSLSTRICSCP